MKNLLKILIAIGVVLFLVKLLFIQPANPEVQLKLSLIESKVSRMGYHTNWIIISGKRSKWLNSLLVNSAKSSQHLKGTAIDIYVFDINGDGKFSQADVKIIEKACKAVEKENPSLVGGFGTYLNAGFFSKRMVHIDTRGYYKRWY